MTIDAKVQPEKRGEFLDAMVSLQKERFTEQGITASKVYESSEDGLRFLVIDDWETDEDLQRYFLKSGFRVLLGALRTLCSEAEIKYNPLRTRSHALQLQRFRSVIERRSANDLIK
jgi:quinol monooxygenase YgiN